MSAWPINCIEGCGHVTKPSNIVDLLENHVEEDGYFLCEECGSLGYIEKSLDLQEGETVDIYLKGAIRLNDPEEPYQPFIFLYNEAPPDDSPCLAWFRYYKDLRSQGGALRMGDGPGGGPILDLSWVYNLCEELKRRGLLGDG